MKKELRKSTKNKTMSSYYATCSWYPKEAETSELTVMSSTEYRG